MVAFLLACNASSEESPRGCASSSSGGPSSNPGCLSAGSWVAAGPIALGATAHLRPGTPGPETASPVAYKITSDAPDIVAVVDAQATDRCGVPVALVVGKKRGTATVTFRSSSSTLSARVTVEEAERVTIVPFFDSLVGTIKTRNGKVPPAVIGELAEVAGGRMRWLARYVGRDDVLLRGRGALTFTPPAFASASLVDNDKDRELFDLVMTGEGQGELIVKGSGAETRFPVRGLPVSKLASLEVYVQDDSSAKEKEQLGLLARTYDAEGKPVYGAPTSLSMDSRSLGAGELLFYNFRAANNRVLRAQVGALREEVTVRAADDDLRPSDGNEFSNCSFGRGSSGAAGWAFSLAVALLSIRRLRGARASGPPAGGS